MQGKKIDFDGTITSSFFPAAMKIRELLEASLGGSCPLAIQHVCLVSAHRCSGRKKKEA